MAKFKAYDYRQRVFLPVSLEDQLLPWTLEFAIHMLVETRLDTSGFEQKYRNDETGRTAYDPKILLKIVLLGYSRGLVSSRKIEQACGENVVFIALAWGQQPDHSTVAAFVSSMKDEILPLFRDILLVCQEMDLRGTFFALDGLKLPSNASKEWSGTRSELQRKKERLEAKVKELLEEHVQEDNRDDPPSGPGGGIDRERQAQRLQKQAERLEKWLKENKARHGTTGKEISSNVTDNDSAKMKTAHGVIQGYNSQALIDAKHQVIIHGEAFGNGQTEPGRISRAWAMVRSILPTKSSPLTPTITATPICGNARSCAWMPISLTGISAGGTPATRPNGCIGPGGRGLS